MNKLKSTELIDALLDGEISEADFLLLEAEMHVDAELRQLYYDRIVLTDGLRTEAEAWSVQHPIVAKTPPPKKFSTALLWSWGAMAALLVVGALLYTHQKPSLAGGLPVASSEPQATGFAVVAGQSNVVWSNSADLQDGDLLPLGELGLDSGVVKLELFSGVTVVLEGDARFEVHSPMEMTLTRGKFHASVPTAAQGFAVNTAQGQVVDLGTEFAIDASAGSAQLHVLDGEVEWHPTERPKLLMQKGEALELSVSDQGAEVVADVNRFVTARSLSGALQEQREERYQSWLASQEAFSNREDLIVHYRLAGRSQRNRVIENATEHASEGAIVAASPGHDRWGNEFGALDFSRTGSRIRLSVPGEHQSLTLLCWVKINSLDRWYNSLFLTDGHDLGEPHWQMMDNGSLFFSVKKRDGAQAKHNFFSPPFWNASLSGQWLQLATTYDVEEGMVNHYLNGECVSSEAIPDEFLVENVRIGGATIGNWSEPYNDDPNFAVRNFNGSMDEFALLNTALSAKDISELYQQGRP